MGRWFLFGVLMSACAGCSSTKEPPSEPADPPVGSLLADPLGELPSLLSETGLYTDVTRLRVSRAAIAYEPGYPLFSDGGEKTRFLVLPADTKIDATLPDHYQFPLGTLAFKTFSFKTPASSDKPIAVETRLMRLTEEGWEFWAYGWDEDAADATLLSLRRGELRAVISDEGELIEHRIPSRLECRQCHESAASEVLGVNELQLARSGDLDELSGQLDPQPAEPYASLSGRGPLTSAVLGYFVGNCVHCHNGSNGAASSFDLRPEAALGNLVNRATESSATAAGIRLVPGAPEQSILYLSMSGSENVEIKQMPPLGLAIRDRAAILQVYDFISALRETSPEP